MPRLDHQIGEAGPRELQLGVKRFRAWIIFDGAVPRRHLVENEGARFDQFVEDAPSALSVQTLDRQRDGEMV